MVDLISPSEISLPIQSVNPSVSTLHSPATDSQEEYFFTARKIVKRQNYKSRFTEHFDTCTKNTIDKEFTTQQLPNFPSSIWCLQEQESKSMEIIKSFSDITENDIKSRQTCKTTLGIADVTIESSNTGSNISNSSFAGPMNSPRDMSFTQTHLQTVDPITIIKNDDNRSPTFNKTPDTTTASSLLQSSFSDQSTSTAFITTTSLNMADILIRRLETWYKFLKSIIGWIEEVVKINQQSSRGYFQKANTYLDVSFGEEKDTGAIKSLLSKFKALNAKVMEDQQEFSRLLSNQYLPNLHKLRKECKVRIQVIKMDSSLYMDELYRRAEITQGKMKYLNKCCKQVEKTKGQVDMDPWLANLYLLRQLKKEVDEENRLRLLMIPIQKNTKLFETRILEAVKPAVEFCYKYLLPGTRGDSFDEDSNSMKSFIEQIIPAHEWEDFFYSHKKYLIDESHPVKDYMKISYPNKFHPLVMTLIKGKMEKKSGSRKKFIEKYYVLSQGGYLHQFTMDNKVSPEKTIYIPSATVLFSSDITNKNSCIHDKEERKCENINIFEICKPGANLLQKEKVSVFRTQTNEDLNLWCTYLTRISTGDNSEGYSTQMDYDSNMTTESNIHSHFLASSDSKLQNVELISCLSSGNIQSETSTPPSHTNPIFSSKDEGMIKDIKDSISNVVQELNSPFNTFKRSSPLPQIHEHMNTSIAMNSPTIITENDSNNSSFDFTMKKLENDSYKNHKIDDTQYKDTSSVTSRSTEKGKTNQTENQSNFEIEEPHQTQLEDNSRRIPSLRRVASDDVQSSLYFPSTSVPLSPVCSINPSVVSMPEFLGC
ncbi:unnamed protein product [Rhizopus stolonifer]